MTSTRMLQACSFQLAGNEALTYSLRRTSRRRTVGIYVEPDGSLSVLAPESAPTERIEQILRKRWKWIRRQQRDVESLPPPALPREWVNGETLRYLGRQYRLKLIRSDVESVKLVGAFFVVSLPDQTDRPRIQRLMEAWYLDHTKALLADRTKHVLSATTWLTKTPRSLHVRALRSRWGSTTALGRISFNVDLGKLPLTCIDYVVAHELVHLMVPNHSPAFWRTLERVMPDWRIRQRRLAMVEI
jgi:predicted metal-dependent hydrolase